MKLSVSALALLLLAACASEPADSNPAPGDSGTTGETSDQGGGGSTGASSGHGGSAGGSGSNQRALDGIIPQATQAICGALLRCCDPTSQQQYLSQFGMVKELEDHIASLPSSFSDAASCEATLQPLLSIVPFGDWVAAAKAGSVTFDEVAFASCLSILDEASCGAEVTNALFDGRCLGLSAPVGPAQRSMFKRTQGASSPCEPIRDGVGARFYGNCDPTTTFCCYAKEGVSGCAFPFDGDGNPRQGVCKKASQQGQGCSVALDNLLMCTTGLDCGYDSGVCDDPNDPKLSVGSACMDAAFNSLGACEQSWCDSLGSKLCEPFKPAGQSCQFGYECQQPLACEDGVCGEMTFCAEGG